MSTLSGGGLKYHMTSPTVDIGFARDIVSRFISDRDYFAVHRSPGPWAEVRGDVTPFVDKHLLGEEMIAVPAYSLPTTSLAWDIDGSHRSRPNQRDAREPMIRFVEWLRGKELSPLVFKSRRNGYHVYLMCEPIDVSLASEIATVLWYHHSEDRYENFDVRRPSKNRSHCFALPFYGIVSGENRNKSVEIQDGGLRLVDYLGNNLDESFQFSIIEWASPEKQEKLVDLMNKLRPWR